jgi:hypothetical protein
MPAKDVDAKKVSWEDIVGGDRPSIKQGDKGAMVKSIATICGFDAMSFNMEQLRGICSSLKLTGYRSKPKAELLRIITVGKMHQSFYKSSKEPNMNSEAKAPAKTKNCAFQLIKILFCDEMAAKFANIGRRKVKGILDSSLAAWQEVAKKYQESNESYDELAFDVALFDGVDPSVKLEYNWSKLREIYKGLIKVYSEVFQNNKKSGNHDDFVNFCGSKGEIYYLHLWLQEKPQLEPLLVIELPEDVIFDSAAPKNNRCPRRSLTPSDSSFRGSSMKPSIAASVNALVEELRKAREHYEKPDEYQSKLNKVKLDMQISKNYDEKCEPADRSQI